MNHIFILFPIILFLFYCAKDGKNIPPENNVIKPQSQSVYPAGESEQIIDENGKVVQITVDDPKFFQEPSKNKMEFFRVLISSESYQIRQIRQSENIKRKSDIGGDSLIYEELKKYDKVDFVDDGVIIIKLDKRTGKFDNIKFDTKVPRINDIAKIILNDATRWILEHKNNEEPNPNVLNFLISYNVKLSKKINRDEIKEHLKKEVKK